MHTNRYQPNSDNLDNCYPYIPASDLIDAVNVAIMLKRPLLVKGPPGCGKTKLADSIAHELELDIKKWHIKSTSKARDGLYSIDVIRRLHDVEFDKTKAQRIVNYISFGELGEILRSKKEAVLLIDEIDKADIDFPNDLLHELEENEFTISEINEKELTDEERREGWKATYSAKATAPIVIITSNDEKELPEAFLRRCIFHYIDFPNPDQLINIVKVNTRGLNLDEELVTRAVDRLLEFRGISNIRKQPATSELIDWVKVLHHWQVDFTKLQANDVTDLPFWKVLFKHNQDWQQVQRETKVK